MTFEKEYGSPCKNNFNCNTCEKKNTAACLRIKLLYSNEKAEIRRCEINNKKRIKNGIESFKRNTKSGKIFQN